MKRKKFAILLVAVALTLSCVGCRMTDGIPDNRSTVPITPTNPVVPDVIPDTIMPGDNNVGPDINIPNNNTTVPNNNNGTTGTTNTNDTIVR